ncbi:uncharacterized protein LOC116851564 [Odontomachus brunneus]|uniref:uncharacterized protein LOC116851564 n=1 Tax=Odontomachus brunneus TaxID=486640 RepID=UPI0013F189A1|nr:uncharacterized protein LOC116851564 [Odontomachus brunneus]
MGFVKQIIMFLCLTQIFILENAAATDWYKRYLKEDVKEKENLIERSELSKREIIASAKLLSPKEIEKTNALEQPHELYHIVKRNTDWNNSYLKEVAIPKENLIKKREACRSRCRGGRRGCRRRNHRRRTTTTTTVAST